MSRYPKKIPTIPKIPAKFNGAGNGSLKYLKTAPHTMPTPNASSH